MTMHKINPNVRNQDGTPLLIFAIQYAQLEFADYLAQKEEIELGAMDSRGYTAFTVLRGSKDPEVAKCNQLIIDGHKDSATWMRQAIATALKAQKAREAEEKRKRYEDDNDGEFGSWKPKPLDDLLSDIDVPGDFGF